MRRSPAQRRLYALSIVFAILPPVFGAIRFIQTHSDLRMLWMALASLLGAGAVMFLGRARDRTTGAVLTLSIVALVVAMLLAGWTAMRLGATAAPGIWLVAFVLSFCWVTSFALDAFSRPRPA